VEFEIKMNDKPKIILHIGVPKTASTTLQYQLSDNEGLLNHIGIGVPHRFIFKNDVHEIQRLLIKSRETKNEKLNVSQMQNQISSLISKHPLGLVLSNESCLGEPFMDGKNTFFPLSNQSAEVLKKMFDGYDLYIIVVLRRQEELVKSYYSQVLRHGRTISFEDFCVGKNNIDLSWFNYLKSLERITIPENISVFHFDTVKKDVNILFSEILKIFKVANMAMSFNKTKRNRNPSLPICSFNLIIFINKILNGGGREGKKQLFRRYLVDAIGRLAPKFGQINNEDIESIKNNYEVENAQLCKITPAQLNIIKYKIMKKL